MEGDKFEIIRSKCLSSNKLFEDREFPAVARSIYFSKIDRSIYWSRPTDICSQPFFMVDGASRFDLDQGQLGDCWYVAAVATLATRPKLFERVVPVEQCFDETYAGIFRFNFWFYGGWIEVIIDDRLPTSADQQLVFCSNRERPDEFWPGLLEKAYAKLAGSYEALDGGWIEDALVDFTGGIGQRIDLTRQRKKPQEFLKFLYMQNKMNTLMGTSINATRRTTEERLENGLFLGHAYSITSITEVKQGRESVTLLRLRNPWGRGEWNGRWSDRSNEWLKIGPQTRQSLGLVLEEDGEFWISFEDWLENFQNLHLCHLPPNTVVLDNHKDWTEVNYNGSWVRGVNAGGSYQKRDLYWTNTQYFVNLVEQRGNDKSYKYAVVVSLMQKYSKRKRTQQRTQFADVCLMLDIYKVNSGVQTSTSYSSKQLTFVGRFGKQHEYYREIAEHFFLEAGNYVVIPFTFESNIEAEYLLRVYASCDLEGNELDIKSERIQRAPAPKNHLRNLFGKFAGNDEVIDARELQLLLNEVFISVGNSQFDLESCRSLMTMVDKNHTGTLDYNETEFIWKELNVWFDIFKQFDKDNSGFIESLELRRMFTSLGFSLGAGILKLIARRYGGKEYKLSFNEFVVVSSKIVTIFEKYPSLSSGGLDGPATLNLDSLLQLSLCL